MLSLTMAMKPGQHLSFLAQCTRLLSVDLELQANLIDSWRGLVTVLHEIVAQLISPVISEIRLELYLISPKDDFAISALPDSEFPAIDLGSIHDLMKRPLFNSLHGASVLLGWARRGRLTCDAVITAEEIECRLRLILEPWEKRGILTVSAYDEATDEEIRRERAMLHPEREDAGEGAGGKEAYPPEDETVLASDQDNEGGHGGAVQDAVEDSEG